MLHIQTIQHFWLTSGGARRESILVAWLHLHCDDFCYYPNYDTAILECWCFWHSIVVIFLTSLVIAVLALQVHRVYFLFETSRSIRIWIPVEMYRGHTSTTHLQFQAGRSWQRKSLNSSHSKYLLNLICKKWILIVIWKHQVNLFGKTVVPAEIYLSFCWLH